MHRFKFFLVAVFAAAGIISCPSPKGKRYDIAGSKTYEASLFRQNCAICHGPEGEGRTLDDGKQIPNIRDGEHKFTTETEIYKHIAEGGNGMTPFRDQLSERELRMMVDFVVHDLRAR